MSKRKRRDEDCELDSSRKRFKNLEKRLNGLHLDPRDIASSSGDMVPNTSRSSALGTPISLALRFPNGSRNQVALHTRAKVDEVFSFIGSCGVLASKVVLVLQYPRRVISPDDCGRTLQVQDVGITQSELVFVEEK